MFKLINILKEKIRKKQEELNDEKERLQFDTWINSISQEERMKYSIFHDSYMFKLEHLSGLEGCGNDYANYDFYETMDDESREGIEPFEGLRVSLNYPGKGEIFVSYEELLKLMEEVKPLYLKRHPEEKETVEKYIEEFKNNIKAKLK